MRKLHKDKRTMIVRCLSDGTGINATARICGGSKLTVLRIIADLGMLCRDFHDLTVRRLQCKRVQADEIWSFVGCKQRSREQGKQGIGDVWTWVAMDADQNLSLRLFQRRFTRLTLGFSKRLENHLHAIALHYFHYNFIRRHKTLGTTPAVTAGIADQEWTVDNLIAMLEAEERKLANGGRINRADRS